MLYDLDYAIAGLIFMLFLYFFLMSQYNKEVRNVKVLKILFICLISADFMDCLSAVTISYTEVVPLWVNYLLNTIYFELEVLCISIFPKYIRSIISTSKEDETLFDKLNDILLVIYAVICATTPWTHSIFYFDENQTYQHGYLYYLIFVLPLYFFIYSLIKLFKNKKSFNRRQYLSIIGFIAVAFMGPVLQMTVAGDRIVDYYALSLAALIIILGLETPDFLKLEKTLIELEQHKALLEVAKQNEEERNKIIHEMTRSASWSLLLSETREVTDSYWSEEFFWLLDYEENEVSPDTNLWSDSLHPDDKEAAQNAFFKGMQDEEPFDYTYRLRDKNGTYRWYRGTGELKVFPDGKAIYQGIIQDVNDEIIKEELSKERLAALEELEKSQEALKEALKSAEAADRAKSVFLANMSHEIRTPINAILGMNELIYRESSEETIQGYSSNIADAGNALLSLINDILDISKIEAGKMELTQSDYELSSLLREVRNIMNGRCIDKGLEFRMQNNPNIPNNLYGDEVRVRQILLNLLSNAIKYTDKGSITLTVNHEMITKANTTLILAVHDTGIGIKEEDITKLFDSFKRIDLERNKYREGTGLGLNITRSFIELMGGEIKVQSKYGEGSTFIVRIPQGIRGDEKIGTFAQASNEVPSENKKYESSFTANKAKILVVDDISINLKVVAGLLKQTGLKIETALSGEECLEMIKETAFDIILLDHMMPNMDGIETLQHIKEDTTHPNQNTPVIMLTANAILGAKEEYLDKGFTDYLSKPVRPDELEAMLQKYLPKEKID